MPSCYHVGFQTIEENEKAVKPLSPFSNDPQSIVYDSFIDYETGEIKQGPQYFKQLSITIIEYANHLESKFDGDNGTLERKHVLADSVICIGKKANNINEQAEALGVSRSTFQGIKKRIRESGDVNLYTPAVKRVAL